jgi:molybdopterin-biosynthesis enzyme MoeA-like protein
VLIDNPVSKAPGFQIDNVFVMAGVPRIMQAMFEGIRHRLTGGAPVLSGTVTAAVGEGVLAGPLGEIQTAHPAVEIGSYPYFRSGRFGVSVVARGTDQAAVDAALDAVRRAVHELGATLTDAPVEADD